MKLKSMVLAVTIGMFAASLAQAAPAWVGLTGGATIPTGDTQGGAKLSDVLKTGYHGGVTGTWGVGKMFGLGADVVYHQLKGKNVPAGDKLTVSPLQATIHGSWMPDMKGSKAMPFVTVGAGVYSIKSKYEAGATSGFASSDTTVTKFGWNAGAGVNWKLNDKFAPGIEAKYHMISTEGKSTSLITVAINLLWSAWGK